MKQIPNTLIAALSIVITGCTGAGTDTSQDYLLQATLWFQQSAEMKALYYQSFNWAERELKRQIEEGADRPLAVILDIDETVLDNSPQTARQILDDQPYNSGMWDEWCSLTEAEPLPGSLAFTRYASENGVEVFYISNRGIHLLEVTLKNLSEAGFPYADSAHVLLKTNTSAKDSRRGKVGETHEIALLIGDNLGDFSGIFNDRKNGAAGQQVEANRDLFGTTYIVLPNPMYGAWESRFRGESPEETVRMKIAALRAFRDQKE
jgi:5'-nucleotidase (lipoprotein e(P4) family)